MLNILFSLFLFGMLVSASIRVFRKAVKEGQPVTAQELALLVALCLGSLIALHRGAYTLYGVSLDIFY